MTAEDQPALPEDVPPAGAPQEARAAAFDATALAERLRELSAAGSQDELMTLLLDFQGHAPVEPGPHADWWLPEIRTLRQLVAGGTTHLDGIVIGFLRTMQLRMQTRQTADPRDPLEQQSAMMEEIGDLGSILHPDTAQQVPEAPPA